MASSPLTLAMLGGGGGLSYANPALYNPQLLGAEQKLGLARSMIGSSLDSSAAYPAQALSRLGQALIGGIMMKRGMADLSGAGIGQQGDLGASQDWLMNGGASGATQTQEPTPQAAAPQSKVPSGGAVSLASYQPLIDKTAADTGVPAQYLTGMFNRETGDGHGNLQPNAVNPSSGATGVAQALASTAANPGYGVSPISQDDLRDPSKAIPWAGQYLAARGKALGTDWSDPQAAAKALSAYGGDASGNYGRTVVAQAGNVATDATPVGSSAAPQAPASHGLPPSGMQNADVQHALAIQQRAAQMLAAHPFPMDPMHIQAQNALEYSKTLMGIGTWQTLPDGTLFNRVTGETKNAATPLAHYVNTPTGAEDTTGTHEPKYMPSPRVFQTPAGDVGQVGPGGQSNIISPANNPGVAARASANAVGTATGKQAATTADKMFDLGREADTALGNIDYGLNQLHQAKAGGVNTGYFAPWLATAAAAGKSLGVDLSKLGVDPQAVGNIQSAQKTLGVVAGSILQNTIGKDSQITDAKIQHFIHTQPGIETDPDAIDRIMNWARSQFVYNRSMAMDAMQNVDPNTGILPAGWRASYVARNKAFAPIYDPLSGEMKQPQGEAPPMEAPKMGEPVPAAQAAPAQPSRAELEAEMRRRGLLK